MVSTRCSLHITALVFLSTFSSSIGEAAEKDGPPNIVIIYADDKYYEADADGRKPRENPKILFTSWIFQTAENRLQFTGIQCD